jgi:hypothetical protein
LPTAASTYNTAGSEPVFSIENEAAIDSRNTLVVQAPNNPDCFLIKRSNLVISEDSWNKIETTFPSLFPFGYGGLRESVNSKRHYKLNLKDFILRCLRVHGHRFENHYAFIGIAFDKLALKNAFEKNYHSLRVNHQAVKSGQITAENIKAVSSYVKVRETCLRLGVRPPAPSEEIQKIYDLRYGIKKGMTAYFGSNAQHSARRIEALGAMKRLGPFQFFITLSQDTAGTYSIGVHAGKISPEAIERMELSLLPDRNSRHAISNDYPFTSATYHNLQIESFVKDVLRFDTKTGQSFKGGGILGMVKHYFFSVETTKAGNLHTHMLIWLNGFPKTINDLNTILLNDVAFRLRLESLLDITICNNLPVMDSVNCVQTLPEGSLCPGTIYPLTPFPLQAFQKCSRTATPIPLSKCDACGQKYGANDILTARIKKSVDNLSSSPTASHDLIKIGTDYYTCIPPNKNICEQTLQNKVLLSISALNYQVHFFHHLSSCFKVQFFIKFSS